MSWGLRRERGLEWGSPKIGEGKPGSQWPEGKEETMGTGMTLASARKFGGGTRRGERIDPNNMRGADYHLHLQVYGQKGGGAVKWKSKTPGGEED